MLVRADSAVALSGAVEAAARLQKVARFEKATLNERYDSPVPS
jgi:hypothetical protein